MPSWSERITDALVKHRGVAHRMDIVKTVKMDIVNKGGKLPKALEETVQGALQRNSSDSKRFNGRTDLFYSVTGIGSGFWGLRGYEISTPEASDLPEETAERRLTTTYRILRDTALARNLKRLHKDKCQVCGENIYISDGVYYSEAHHIRPLGRPHNGPDSIENIMVLCPNHHAMLDYGVIKLDPKNLRTTAGHSISQVSIKYHNEMIFRGDPL